MGQQEVCANRRRIEIGIDVAQVRNDHVADSFRPPLGIHDFSNDASDFLYLIDRRHVGTHGIEFQSGRFHLLAIDFGRGDHGAMTACL